MWLYLVFDTLKTSTTCFCNCDLHETGWIKIPQNLNITACKRRHQSFSLFSSNRIRCQLLNYIAHVVALRPLQTCKFNCQSSEKKKLERKSRALRRQKWSKLNIYKLEILCVKLGCETRGDWRKFKSFGLIYGCWNWKGCKDSTEVGID